MKHFSDFDFTINLNLVHYIQNVEDKLNIYFTDGRNLTINCGTAERAKDLHKRIIGQ